jgi:hypothetical protein
MPNLAAAGRATARLSVAPCPTPRRGADPAALVLERWFRVPDRRRAPGRLRHELRDALLTDALAAPARGTCHLADEYLALGARVGAVAAP